ncbi:hypothetical protein ACJ6UB_23250 [Escherichia coli]
MQKAHLEWLHRALSQPRRLVPRYYRNLKYSIYFIKNKVWKTANLQTFH